MKNKPAEKKSKKVPKKKNASLKTMKKKAKIKAVKKGASKTAVSPRAGRSKKKAAVSKKALSSVARIAKSKALKISLEGLSFKESIAAVCDALRKSGFDPVLTGRSCAAIYSGEIQKPQHADFVISEYISDEIRSLMKRMGFSYEGHRTYKCRHQPYAVVFHPPPLTVGDNVVDSIAELKTPSGVLHLLNPTDCVRQRLAVYYRFSEDDALDDAVRVARSHGVDLKLVERWSHWEWAIDKFHYFMKLLEAAR